MFVVDENVFSNFIVEFTDSLVSSRTNIHCPVQGNCLGIVSQIVYYL